MNFLQTYIRRLQSQQKTIDLIILAISGFSSATIRTSLQNRSFNPYTYNLAGALSAFALVIVFNWIRQFVFTRKFVDPRQNLVGTWIETVDLRGEEVCGILRIKYSSYEDKFSVDGCLFKHGRFEPLTQWESMSVSLTSNTTLFYTYLSEDHDDNRQDIGMARMNFVEIQGRIADGSGFLIDSHPSTTRYNFKFDRLSKEMIKKLIDKDEIENVEDRYNTVSSYLKMKNKNLLYEVKS